MRRTYSIVVKGWLVIAAIAFAAGGLGIMALYTLPLTREEQSMAPVILVNALGEIAFAIVITTAAVAALKGKEWGRRILIGVNVAALAAALPFGIWYIITFARQTHIGIAIVIPAAAVLTTVLLLVSSLVRLIMGRADNTELTHSSASGDAEQYKEPPH